MALCAVEDSLCDIYESAMEEGENEENEHIDENYEGGEMNYRSRRNMRGGYRRSGMRMRHGDYNRYMYQFVYVVGVYSPTTY